MNSSYSSQFKQDAIKLAVESDQSVAKTARDLGVNANTLYTWVTKFQQSESSITKGAGDNNPYDQLYLDLPVDSGTMQFRQKR